MRKQSKLWERVEKSGIRREAGPSVGIVKVHGFTTVLANGRDDTIGEAVRQGLLGDTVTFARRCHCRLIMEPGIPLEKFNSPYELVGALVDAIQGAAPPLIFSEFRS